MNKNKSKEKIVYNVKRLKLDKISTDRLYKLRCKYF